VALHPIESLEGRADDERFEMLAIAADLDRVAGERVGNRTLDHFGCGHFD